MISRRSRGQLEGADRVPFCFPLRLVEHDSHAGGPPNARASRAALSRCQLAAAPADTDGDEAQIGDQNECDKRAKSFRGGKGKVGEQALRSSIADHGGGSATSYDGLNAVPRKRGQSIMLPMVPEILTVKVRANCATYCLHVYLQRAPNIDCSLT